MRTSGKIVVSILGIMFLVVSLRLASPEIPNPPVTAEFTGPDSITMIFKRACYDCHSNETRLAWYDRFAPISWKVAADVSQARDRFNLSHWDSLSTAEQQTTLWYMVNMIEQGRMPLKEYTALHPEAVVSKKEIAMLKRYVVSLSAAPSGNKQSAPAATPTIPATIITHKTTPVSPNGIEYFSDYKQWKVIAATNRFDNGTMRLIYGNDIAVKALEQNTINPWPNGAKIAKVVWNLSPEDADGNVHTGSFNNVQFMLKDDRKFKDTGGWGFARFSTPELLPYGKDASFGTSCYNCHRLASANGFVFDIPTKPAIQQ